MYDVPPEIRWKVMVSLESNIPDTSKLHYFLRRTGDGLGPGYVSGGRSYLRLSDQEKKLFSGEGEINNVELQLKIDGISPTIPEFPFDIKLHFRVVI